MGSEAQMPAVAVREGSRRETPADEAAGERVATSRAPLLALGAIVAAAFVVYSLLATLVDVPRVHPDEVRYLIGASSIVEGEGLTQRGHEYGFGPLYALFLAAILLVTGGADAGYDALKAGNALVFALTAVPVYLLARRLVSEWWAVLAAGLSVAIPSSISIATVMTESLAYLTAVVALLAIVRALERPSVGRQLVVLATVGAAFLTRPQFGSHYLVWLGGLALMWVLLPARRPRTRDDLVRYWPTALPLALAAAVVVGRVLSGSDQSESFGAYWELWRGYDPVGVGKWLLYHLADFEIYLAVVPLAVAPVVLWSLLRRGRAGSEREAAFAALFLAANAVGLFVVAAFNSTPYAYDRLHDRYVFYLLPLWLIVFVVWLAEGMPRPVVALATGVVVALALPAILPFRQLANEAGIDTVPGALWIWIESQLAGPGPLSGRVALAVFVLALLAAAVLLPARFRLVLPAAVLAVFFAMGVAAWERIADAPEDLVFAGGLERDWIDDEVPEGAVVWKLYLESQACPATALTRHSLFATEFFNTSVDRAAYIGASIPDGIEIDEVDVGTGGAVVLRDGGLLEAEYVYTQPGIELNAQTVATGTAANLALWRVGGLVRIVGAESNEDVRTADCGAA